MRSAVSPRRTTPSPRLARLRSPRRIVAVATALAASIVAGALAAAPAEADSSKHLRLDAVTASSNYLIYLQKVSTPYSLGFTKGSALFSVSRDGKRRAITDFDPQLFPSLNDSTLTQSAEPNARNSPSGTFDPAAPEHVRWRDLRTGAHGVTEIPAADDYVSAAPGGWIATRRPATSASATHVLRYATSGSAIDLGAPFAAGIPWDIRPGVAGVIAFSAADPEEYSEPGTVGVIRYQPYSAPGRWRTIYAPGPDASMYCASPSSSQLLCEVHGTGTSHSGQVLIPLQGGKRRWLDAHPSACQTLGLQVVGSSAFGKSSGGNRACPKGQIQQLSAKGVLTLSKRTYGSRGNYLSGLGGFVFASADQRTLLRVTSAGGTPRAVATAR